MGHSQLDFVMELGQISGKPWADLGQTLGKGWRGGLGNFIISRPIQLNSEWLKFSIWNGVIGK